MKKVIIKGVAYKLRYSLRMFFLFENILKRPFEATKTADIYLLMYCCLLANNEDVIFSFDDFIDMCDDDSGIFPVFAEMIQEKTHVMESLQPEVAEKKK